MKNDQIFFHVDANSFYANCEREFQPHLYNSEIIVLSNNDGNVVALTPGVKALGIKRGAPYHEVKHLCARHNVAVFSSNFPLYTEMSARFMHILGGFVAPDEQEIYSIDECFLNVTQHAQLHPDLTAFAHEIKNRVKMWIGLPCCVGIGHTKTQAKYANFLAKKNAQFNGVCNTLAMPPGELDAFMQNTPVAEVWGVGRQHTKRLQALGINTVMDLKQANPDRILKYFSVVMKRTILELNGQSCLAIDDQPEPSKQIIRSNSFAKPISDRYELHRAVTYFALKAVGKLREQGSLCGMVTVFAHTSPFNPKVQYYSRRYTIGLKTATDDRLVIVKTAIAAMDAIYEERPFKKAGVMLDGIFQRETMIDDLFTDQAQVARRDALSNTYENIQKKFGHSCFSVGFPQFKNNAGRLSENPFSMETLLKAN